MPRAKLFWESPGYRVADAATDTEIAGPFADDSKVPALHAAWLWAHEHGYGVADVQRTRGTIKHAPKTQLPLPTPEPT